MTAPGRRLLLIGGGHAQLFVLEALAQRKLVADDVVLVSTHAAQLHDDMVPGLIEGRYTLDQLSFDLAALARAARAQFLPDTVTRIDAQAHTVTLASGRSLEYDVASVAIGGSPAAASIPGAAAHARFVTPIDRLAALIPAMEAAAQSAGPEPLQVVVVGAGATGVEIALTTRARLDQLGATRAIITLLDSANTLVRQTGAAIAETAERELRRGEVTLRLSTGVEEIGPGHLRLTGGRILSADLILCCGGVEAPTLFRDSALPVDGHGFLTVQDTLAVPGVAGLYGAGEAVSLQYAPRLPRSGGTGMRQGPILAHNVGIALGAGTGTGGPMGRPYKPNSRALALLNTGDGRGIFSYSGAVVTGRWAMAMKDRIDRRFVRRFQRLAAGTPAAVAS